MESEEELKDSEFLISNGVRVINSRSFEFTPGSATRPKCQCEFQGNISEKVVFKLFLSEEIFNCVVDMTSTCAEKSKLTIQTKR